MSELRSRFSSLATLILVLVVLIAAAVSFGIYAWQHDKVSALNSKVKSLNSQLTDLNSQISSLSTKLNQTCQSSQPPACASYNYTSQKGIAVLVFTPAKNASATSPLAVIGEVPGSWSFEAQFPVQLKDNKGNVVAQSPAHLLGDWMTNNLVPFSVQLTYSTAESGSGTLVLQKDNPSGLSKNDDSVVIPVML